MTYDKNPQSEADSQHEETIFILRMIRVKIANRLLIEENSLSFRERDTVFSPVREVFCLIPLEPQAFHMYIVFIRGLDVKLS